MARNIAFSTGAHAFGAGSRGERNQSLIARGRRWLSALSITRNDSYIERYIRDHGGVLTDSIEREITEKFTNVDPGRY